MVATLLTALLIAQSPSTQVIDSTQVERVRAALAEPAVVEPAPSTEPANQSEFKRTAPPWSDGTVLPPYMLTGYPLYHYDFLQQVTPEPFRASALYPGATGPELTPVLKELFTSSSPWMRHRQESHARKEVDRALQDLRRRASGK